MSSQQSECRKLEHQNYRKTFYNNVTKSTFGTKEYFFRRDKRVFHRGVDALASFPLPIDAEEQQRMEMLHDVLYGEIGANYVGPVADVLKWSSKVTRRAIDVRTGEGKWVFEMANMFPHVQFKGLDIAPTYAINLPTKLPNAKFGIFDTNRPDGRSKFKNKFGNVDLVHARDLSMSPVDYGAMLEDAIYVLRPGGLFVSCEWRRSITVSPVERRKAGSLDYAPASNKFFRILNDALDRRGLSDLTNEVRPLLQSSKFFTDVVRRDFGIPIGGFERDVVDKERDERYEVFRNAEIIFARSSKYLLMETGLAENQLMRSSTVISMNFNR
ncbi:hypothetical protein BDQ17DRAFT_1425742 [Cyathus striatus]|nr:hypothetical protein BDQ17DRAFT_1425742 [Cyathus striatus]